MRYKSPEFIVEINQKIISKMKEYNFEEHHHQLDVYSEYFKDPKNSERPHIEDFVTFWRSSELIPRLLTVEGFTRYDASRYDNTIYGWEECNLLKERFCGMIDYPIDINSIKELETNDPTVFEYVFRLTWEGQSNLQTFGDDILSAFRDYDEPFQMIPCDELGLVAYAIPEDKAKMINQAVKDVKYYMQLSIDLNDQNQVLNYVMKSLNALQTGDVKFDNDLLIYLYRTSGTLFGQAVIEAYFGKIILGNWEKPTITEIMNQYYCLASQMGHRGITLYGLH